MKKFLCLLISFGMIVSAHAGNQWRAGTTAQTIPGATNISDIDTVSYQDMTAPLDRLHSNAREGCIIVYASTSTITVEAGEVALQNSAGTITLMQQNTSNTTVSWSDIDTGSEASSTTYYLWAYQATATDTDFDVAISKSSSAPTGITYYARLGSFYNNSSSNIEQAKNDGYVAAMVVATGTIAHGATISLPSGYVASQCKWTVSTGKYYHQDTIGGSGEEGDKYHETTVNSSRVVTCRTSVGSYGSTSAHNGVANYSITCYK